LENRGKFHTSGNVGGDIIGSDVKGSGNIIGKNINIGNPDIVSYSLIEECNRKDINQIQLEISDAIDLTLYEEQQECPFIKPNRFEDLGKKNKLLLYGRSGLGKSRTIIELLKDKIKDSQIVNLFIINPVRSVGERSAESSISQLVRQVSEKDAILWDNFPEGLTDGIIIERGLITLAVQT
jgi:hypothetical protein